MAIQRTPWPVRAAAVLSFVGFAVHLCGFLAVDLALANLLDGLGGLALLMMFGPFGLSLAVLGFLELFAAVGLLGGGILLLCRRRSGVWVTVTASAAGCVGPLAMAARIIPAPIVFGKVAAGMPSGQLALILGGGIVLLAGLTMALAVTAPGRVAGGYGSLSSPCSMA